MLKFSIGFIVGGFLGSMLGRLLPIEAFLIVGIIVIVSAILLFFIFHFGVRDFQGY